MSPRWLLSLVAVCLFVTACAKSPGSQARYPRRKPGCTLAIYSGLPTGAWDDIGVAQVGCYLDESEIACLGRLRTEACRMGGDIIYNLPKKAERPIERGMLYRAPVAHTREANKKDEPAAAAEVSNGPIVPLPNAAPAPAAAPPTAAPADGGAAPASGPQ